MLEPEIQQLVKDFKSLNIDYTKMPASEARKLSAELAAKRPRLPDAPAMEISSQHIILSGRQIPLRIYRPRAIAQKKLPVIVYYHGGGFVFGRAEFYDDPCSIIAEATQSAIISVNYRLAPEFPFPTPMNDCYDALVYIHQHADQFNIDANDIAVAGDSAGGNLAAVVCLRARDERGPAIRAQLLIYPCVEYNFAKKSMKEMGRGDYLLTTELMQWFYRQYLPNRSDHTNQLAMPMYAINFKRLPPALIITATYDPLHDDGNDYAKKLRQGGVNTEVVNYETMNHGFIVYNMICPAARRAVEDIAVRFAKIWQKNN